MYTLTTSIGGLPLFDALPNFVVVLDEEVPLPAHLARCVRLVSDQRLGIVLERLVHQFRDLRPVPLSQTVHLVLRVGFVPESWAVLDLADEEHLQPYFFFGPFKMHSVKLNIMPPPHGFTLCSIFGENINSHD